MQTLFASQHSLESIYEDLFHTLVMSRLFPEADKITPDFEALTKECLALQAKERALVEAEILAQGKIGQADRALDRFVDRVSLVALKLVAGRRDAPLYVRLFGSKSPSEHKKPVLGDQLELLRSWQDFFADGAPAELKALQKELSDLIKESDAAKVGLATNRGKAQSFRTGARVDFVEAANAKRKEAYGYLGQVPHKKPELGLEADYADLFFAKKRRRADKPGRELAQEVAELEALLAEKRADLAEEKLQAQKTEEERQARAQAETKLKELADQISAAEAERKAVTDKLKKTPGPRGGTGSKKR